jgi:hypothetical protein
MVASCKQMSDLNRWEYSATAAFCQTRFHRHTEKTEVPDFFLFSEKAVEIRQ